jgi:hypothetical protein
MDINGADHGFHETFDYVEDTLRLSISIVIIPSSIRFCMIFDDFLLRLHRNPNNKFPKTGSTNFSMRQRGTQAP